MSRSGYSDDLGGTWELIRWRGAVASAIRGKRGQALLKEMEAAILALPQKMLCAHDFANASTGNVCALGSVVLKRRLSEGMSLVEALEQIQSDYPEDRGIESVAVEMNIADALAKEITYINDEVGSWRRGGEGGAERYNRVLKWVQEQIVREGC